MTHQTLLAIKAFERDDGRYIEGWATTPRQDLCADVVVPEGAEFSLPIPPLFAHKHDEPIGAVVEAKVTRAGIRIRAKLTAGVARAEEIWKLILDGALTAVSISFSGLKTTPIAGGGTRYDSWLWHELSVVSCGANPDARISVAKCAVFSAPQEKKVQAVYATDRDVLKVADKLEKSRGSNKAVTYKGLEIIFESYTEGIHNIMRGLRTGLEKRIAELETVVTGQQSKLDAISSHALKYSGEHQSALGYERGAVTRHEGALYVALKSTSPGQANPSRNGSGWEKLTN